MTKSTQTLYPYLYLFITDIAQLPVLIDFSSYERNEPGFAIPYLEAYQYAFQCFKDKMISSELIQSVNAIATAHLKHENRGSYRTLTGYFNIYSEIHVDHKSKFMHRNTAYSMTELGIKEFIRYWFDNPKTQKCHTIIFEYKASGNRPSFSLVYSHEKKTLVWVEFRTGDQAKYTPFEMEIHFPIIQELIHHTDYVSTIYSMMGTSNPAKQIEFQMNRLIEIYIRQIQSAKTDNEKLIVIANFIQRVEQLHPFSDGNIRTCYIILNKLLRDNHLSLSIMYNPNVLDCVDQATVIQMIQEGQKTYQQLLANENTEHLLVDASYTPWAGMMKSITCKASPDLPEQVLESFSRRVLNLASSPPEEIGSQLLLELLPLLAINQSGKTPEIRKVLENSQFALALRKSCAAVECEIANKILDYHRPLSIQVDECSSNGKNALAWLQASTKQSEPKKALIKRLFNMQVKRQTATFVGYQGRIFLLSDDQVLLKDLAKAIQEYVKNTNQLVLNHHRQILIEPFHSEDVRWFNHEPFPDLLSRLENYLEDTEFQADTERLILASDYYSCANQILDQDYQYALHLDKLLPSQTQYILDISNRYQEKSNMSSHHIALIFTGLLPIISNGLIPMINNEEKLNAIEELSFENLSPGDVILICDNLYAFVYLNDNFCISTKGIDSIKEVIYTNCPQLAYESLPDLVGKAKFYRKSAPLKYSSSEMKMIMHFHQLHIDLAYVKLELQKYLRQKIDELEKCLMPACLQIDTLSQGDEKFTMNIYSSDFYHALAHVHTLQKKYSISPAQARILIETPSAWKNLEILASQDGQNALEKGDLSIDEVIKSEDSQWTINQIRPLTIEDRSSLVNFSQRFFASSQEIWSSPYATAAAVCAIGLAAAALR